MGPARTGVELEDEEGPGNVRHAALPRGTEKAGLDFRIPKQFRSHRTLAMQKRTKSFLYPMKNIHSRFLI